MAKVTNGNDFLMGTSGDDVLDGLGGDDFMIGGLGNDAYVVNSPGDFAIENFDEGIDTVYSSVTYVLPDDIERLVLTGTDDIDGYGNDRPNELYGNSGNNSLYGLDSNDVLEGGAGNDRLDSDGGDDRLDGGAGDDSLLGGSGSDTYVFGAGYGHDVVSDAEGADQLLLTGGLTPSDVTFERSGDDLLVYVNGTTDQLRLEGWFVAGSQIESVAFDGDTVLDAAAIMSLVGNSAPTAEDDSASVDEDTGSTTGNALTNDSDPNATDALAVTDAGQRHGAYGTLDLAADGTYRYALADGAQALAAGETVTESFAYSISDNAATDPLGDSALVTVSITGANDAPVLANAMADRTAQAGAAFSFSLPEGAFTDIDHGDSLALGAKLADGSALPEWLNFDPATGTFTGTAPGAAGGTTFAIEVTATDLSGEQATDVFAFAVAQPPPPPPPAEEPSHDGRHIVGTRRKDRLVGTADDDLIEGRNGNDRLRGKGGVDILQGGKGNDELVDRKGNTVFDGGRGNDRMTGGHDDDFFAGGRGNDKLYLGGGADVVAFNKGDGVDRLFGRRQDGVLSLGGGIRYEDLRFSKHGNDLVLRAGGGDRVVLEDWYRGKQSVVTLQVVAEATAGFCQDGNDPLRNDRVEVFDFRKLVQAFDDARACERNLRSWKLMGELLDAHLGGSDRAAFGGDLAYRYGMTGSLAGMGWNAARETVGASEFGNEMQALQPAAEVNAGPVKLG